MGNERIENKGRIVIQQNVKVIENEELKNKSILAEFWDFLKVRKKWWLLPIILMLIFVSILIIFGQSSAVSPFVYALF